MCVRYLELFFCIRSIEGGIVSVYIFYVAVMLHVTFLLQIFYDLVRQINSKTPEKPEKKKKGKCLML